MENKKPLDQTQPTPATPVQQPGAFPNAPTDPAVIQEPKTASMESGQAPNKSNINMWLAVAAIILVIILAAGYFYLSQTSKKEPTTTAPQPASQVAQEGDMQAELNSMDVESEGNDFAEVDKDLQSL